MAISDIAMDIMDEIEAGELTFREIAVKYGVSYDDVDQIAAELRDQYDYEDGSFCDDESAFASAGWGTDESYNDYVYENDYFDDY